MKTRFIDIEFEGDAIALHKGKVIWSNLKDGDCPPDVALMLVSNMYTAGDVLVFELEKETPAPTIEEYRQYDPNAETILKRDDGSLIIITRYGQDDYGVWFTDADHLYDDTFGSSVRGSLADIIDELK